MTTILWGLLSFERVDKVDNALEGQTQSLR